MDTTTIILITAIAFLFVEMFLMQTKISRLQQVVAKLGTLTLGNTSAVAKLIEEKAEKEPS